MGNRKIVLGKRKDGKYFVGFSDDESFPYAIIVVVEDSGSGLKFAGNTASSIMREIYTKYN